MGQLGNLVVMVAITAVVGVALFLLLRQKGEDDGSDDVSRFTIENLIAVTKNVMSMRLRVNAKDLGLSEADTIKQNKLRNKDAKDLASCSNGDLRAKNAVKRKILDIIQSNNELIVTPDNVEYFMHFSNPDRLPTEYKFDIALYWYKKFYRYKAFTQMVQDFGLAGERRDGGGDYYEIMAEDVEWVYYDLLSKDGILREGGRTKRASTPVMALTYTDKLEILTYEIYKQYKGHGVVDELRDMEIDGINCGVNGTPVGLFDVLDDDLGATRNPIYSYNSVWVQMTGKYVHLSCLGFGRQEELVRVCKNIYKYGAPAQLSEAQGCVVTTMKDGSRLVTLRPPFSGSWAFILRKPGTSIWMSIEDLITDEGADIVIATMACIIKACCTVVITGEQGSGKTTLLRVLVQFIRQTYTIRTQEVIFELFLSEIYPNRNIIAMKETDTIDSQTSIDYSKKMDGQVTILGEVAEAKLASPLIQLSQVASLQTMCTHHAKTTPDLVVSIRDNLVKMGDCPNVEIAELTVASTLNFDIHQVRDRKGRRYVERVTEIIPLALEEMPTEPVANEMEYHNRMVQKHCFKTVDIVRFVKHPEGSETFGHYELVNKISVEKQREMYKHLSDEEMEIFAGLFSVPWSEVAS